MSYEPMYDPREVDRTLDKVTELIDALTVEYGEPPTWTDREARDASIGFEICASMNLEQQVAFLRHCALKIRSGIIQREIELECSSLRREVTQ